MYFCRDDHGIHDEYNTNLPLYAKLNIVFCRFRYMYETAFWIGFK